MLIDVLGFNERVTKRIQRELQQEGLVELIAAPQMPTLGCAVMHQAPSAVPSIDEWPNTPRDTAHGEYLRDAC